ncbi:MAG TPA: TonB-dependent receptor, partial [Candidatus Baltobacteraceae bacterium]|nr:TonB-dependent receptor [Candidatus Baltobacteraceae bacterium]
QPRFSATYTESPDTVWRASAGRFTQPPISASVQYLSSSGDNRSVWAATMPLGFYTPFHPIPGISSAQYDLSYERHITGTDMSLKATPFYTWVNQWQQQTFIGAGFVTQVPVGVNRNYGLEFQFSKGDFNREGLSGLFSFTYTNAKVRFEDEGLSTGGTIPNATASINQAIAQYNQLTKAGGGSPCYRAGAAVGCNAKPIKVSGYTFDTIANPYYNQPAQGQLDPNGWYDPYSTAIAPNVFDGSTSYISPAVASLIVNYRHDRWAITPSLQWQAGGFYGNPLDINGYDPRACQTNSGHSGITGVNPLQCNTLSVFATGLGSLGYFYIPNPQTGHFSGINSYENPSLLTGNLQLTYDLSPKIKLTATATDIFHTCFGGTPAPWTAVYQPSPNVCAYIPAGGVLNSTLYPGNFYNGKGITDAKNNGGVITPWTQSYTPGTLNNGGLGQTIAPFNFYINAQVKI